MKRIRGVPEEVQRAAGRLRRETTLAERALWEAIRDRRLDGIKFRRQYAVGGFVLDFCAPAYRLAIELDGGVHDTPEQIERDAARTERLVAHGYGVLRFRNEEVMHSLPEVLQRIRAALENPSPAIGRGVAQARSLRRGEGPAAREHV